MNPLVLYERVLEQQREQLDAEEKAADARHSAKPHVPEMPPPRRFVPPVRRYRREFATAEERERARRALIRAGLEWVLS